MAASARITRAWERPGAASLPRSAHADMTGRLVGNYRLVRRIGEGGMGAVYEAVHQQLPRRVAIKLLGAEFASEPEILERFFNEARAVNIVQHPDIVSISELGQLADGTAYLVMELLQGEPLSARMQRMNRLPPGDAVRLARQIALALAAAHARGIVHRDLKPDNVMIVADPDSPGGERAKLLDFGIAKLAEEHQGARQVKTRSGVVLGTPVYMSPEQCRGAAEVDHKADVYSLGVMLYQMLAGQPPFVAEGEGELVAMHIYEEPTPVREHVPIVPEALSSLVQQMLEKDRTQRPTMAEVAARLGELAASLSGAQPVSPLVPRPGLSPSLQMAPVLPPPEPRSRPLWLVPLAMLLAAGIVAAVVGSLWQARSSRSAPVATASSPQPQRIRWTVLTEPPGADIVRVADGKVLSRTPFHEVRLAAPGSLAVVLRREGFAPKPIELDLSANVLVREVLEPLEQPAPSSTPEPRRPPRMRSRFRPRTQAAVAAPSAPAVAAPSPPPRVEPPAHQVILPEVQDFEQVAGTREP
ncbi:MAG: serine/threonine protein kinase [Myxococcota bacterium]|nr:serine/threonine protein kinase [Myxococcota bacterium]